MNAHPLSRLFLISGILCSWTAAAGELRLPESFDLQAVDAYLTSRVLEPDIVGLTVALVKDGQVVLAKGYGRRSIQDNRPVEPDTLFAIGSVSKQFTCACVLLLAEQGRLSVQDPVAKYYPGLTRAKDITLLDLMHHVSGYPDYYPLDYVDRRMQKSVDPDELLRQYAGGKLDFEPGSRWSYSNTGYILLGRVVEKVAGESFGEFVTRQIFKPLGMAHSLYEPNSDDPRLAQGCTSFALSKPEPIGPEAHGWIGAAGGIFSTPGDLAKWNLALLNGRLLQPKSYALMITPRTLSNGKTTDYGCGLSVRSQAGRQVLSHNGAVSGFNAWNAMIPSTQSAVIMMANLDGGLRSIPGDLFALLLKDPTTVPMIQGPPAAETTRIILAQMQKGKIDRHLFSDEFNHFLTDEKLAGASKRLKRYGKAIGTEVLTLRERGGMEVSVTRLTCKSGNLRSLMYRQPDGKIEQFFVDEDR